MAKRKEKEYKVHAYIRVTSIPENENGATYLDRIMPQLIPVDEYFDNEKYGNVSRAEWWRQKEEKALSKFYGAEVKITYGED